MTADNTGTESTFGSVEFKEADFDSNTYRDHISHDEVFVELSYDIAENSYLIRTYAADNTVIASTELYELSSYISVLLENRGFGLGISEGRSRRIMSPYYSGFYDCGRTQRQRRRRRLRVKVCDPVHLLPALSFSQSSLRAISYGPLSRRRTQAGGDTDG